MNCKDCIHQHDPCGSCFASSEYKGLETLNTFFRFLQNKLEIAQDKAELIINQLSDELSVIPSHITCCKKCGILYDAYSEGFFVDVDDTINGRTVSQDMVGGYCGECEYITEEVDI